MALSHAPLQAREKIRTKNYSQFQSLSLSTIHALRQTGATSEAQANLISFERSVEGIFPLNGFLHILFCNV